MIFATYLIVKDFDMSVSFYKAFLNMDVTHKNQTRWAQFDIGGTSLSLYNPKFDDVLIGENEDLKEHYNDAYIRYHKDSSVIYGNNVVLNFGVDDLNVEYGRLKALDIGAMSDMMYVNTKIPYWYFNLYDPDGNVIEITGRYVECEKRT